MSKAFARAFYNSQAWKTTREAYKKQAGFLCEDCLQRGRIVPGAEVHHIIPLTPENIADPRFSLSPANLVLLCRECHTKRHEGTAGQRGAKRVRRYHIDPNSGEVAPLIE